MFDKHQASKNAVKELGSADLGDDKQQPCRQVYNAPKFTSYGPLAKNITLGFLSGAETDSTFAV